MAVGVAACGSFLAWLMFRMMRDPSVSLQNLGLKREGRLLRAGGGALAVAVLVGLLVLQSGFVNYQRGRAEHWDRRVTLPAEVAFREDRAPLPDEMREAAGRAANHYARADRIGAGGFGLLPTPEIAVRRAWLDLVRGHFDDAAAQLRRVIAGGRSNERTRTDLARVVGLAGRPEEAITLWREIVADDPANPVPHRALARLLEQGGDREGAVAELVVLVNLEPTDFAARTRLVELLRELGHPDEAARYR